jgi:hypothetical protein
MFKLIAALGALGLAGCSTFTVEAGLSEQVTGKARVHLSNGSDVTHEPLGRIALYFEPSLTRTVTARLGVEHLSYPETDFDRGQERIFAALTWKPFAGGAR